MVFKLWNANFNVFFLETNGYQTNVTCCIFDIYQKRAKDATKPSSLIHTCSFLFENIKMLLQTAFCNPTYIPKGKSESLVDFQSCARSWYQLRLKNLDHGELWFYIFICSSAVNINPQCFSTWFWRIYFWFMNFDYVVKIFEVNFCFVRTSTI